MGDVSATARVERILIIKPSSLGDIVHALPVLAALRDAYPHAHIAWLAASAFAPLLEGHPLLNEVIRFERGHLGRMWRNPNAALELLRLIRELRGRRFDLVIDLQGLFRSGFFAWACGAPRRIGFSAAREFGWAFLTESVADSPGVRHAVDRNLQIVRALGLSTDAVRFPLGLREDELSAARQNLIAEGLRSTNGGEAASTDLADGDLPPFIAIVPGARWETKLWRPERWAALIDHLEQDHQRRCVLLGAPSDLPFVRRIEAFLHGRPVSLVGKTTLRELAAVLAIADRVVCHDSGPMHLAAALGKPLVALFGPTDPKRCGPYYVGGGDGQLHEPALSSDTDGDGAFATIGSASAAASGIFHHRPERIRDRRELPILAGRGDVHVLLGNVPCSPCYRRTCWHHSCMKRLTTDDVLAAVLNAASGAEADSLR